MDERGSWPEETRAYWGTDYIKTGSIHKHFKRIDKGKLRNQQGAGFIFDSKERNARDQVGWDTHASAKKRKAVISKSKELARAFLKALQAEELLPTLGAAGRRTHMSAEVCEEHEQVYTEFMGETLEAARRRTEGRNVFDEAELAAIQESDYQA